MLDCFSSLISKMDYRDYKTKTLGPPFSMLKHKTIEEMIIRSMCNMNPGSENRATQYFLFISIKFYTPLPISY